LDATLRLLRSGGPGAITHRAVAREAGVPLAATTYYFASKSELLAEALDQIAREELVRLQQMASEIAALGVTGEAVVPQAAAAIAKRLSEDSGPILLQLEIYVEAARHPELQDVARRRIAAFEGLAEAALRTGNPHDSVGAAKVFMAAVDGIMLHRLTTGAPPDADEVEALLTRLLYALLR
jgi:DNA-binding transcriptional regulator YbjK